MKKTGIYIETVKGTVKKSCLEAMTIASGREILAILTEKLTEDIRHCLADYGAEKIIEFDAGITTFSPARIKEIKRTEHSDGKDLEEASIVVAGGRGAGSPDNFALIETFAEKLGAAVGTSRAAVDLGYAPYTMQVGQTGKSVAPDLYIACGISGTAQHFDGIKEAKVILAINTDRNAPIFAACDYGIIGDLMEVIPLFSEKL